MRERTYSAVVLKKQPLGEGDELITFYTREAGKLRAVAKSSKFSKSKLQYGLQTLFWINLAVAGGALPRVIGAEVLDSFAGIRDRYDAATMSLYAVELVLKGSPDEQKNEPLFGLLASFLKFLETAADASLLQAGLAKFKMEFLESLGLGVRADGGLSASGAPGFSQSRGGFTAEAAADSMPASPEALRQFLRLRRLELPALAGAGDWPPLHELNGLLSGFINYHLERDIKSERYLRPENMV